MNVPPETRRANRWLLLGLILFALSLALTVFFWMRVKIRENGGTVDPTYSRQLESPGKGLFASGRPAIYPSASGSGQSALTLEID